MMILSNGLVLTCKNGYYFGENGDWWIWDEYRAVMMNMESGECSKIKEAA